MLRCDLHVHTDHSSDGESSVSEILIRAKSAGIDAIAITDHDTVEGALEALSLESEILVIPGIEVSTSEGHLLLLGITEPVAPGMSFSETVLAGKEAGAVAILPHPFHWMRHGAGLKFRDAVSCVDAVECFNSRYIIGYANRIAEREAKKFKKPCVGGSDAHNARYVGYGYTLVDSERETSAILNAVLDGRVQAAGKRTPLGTYAGQSGRNTARKAKRLIYRR